MKIDILMLAITMLTLIFVLIFIPMLYVGIPKGNDFYAPSKGLIERLHTKGEYLPSSTKISYFFAQKWLLRLVIGLACLGIMIYVSGNSVGQQTKIICLMIIIGVSVIWGQINIFGIILLI